MKYLKFARNIVYYLAIILLVFVCLVTTASVFEIPGGYRFFMVESGSMEPSIQSASVILIKGESDYEVDDVVTYSANFDRELKASSLIVTHRIYGEKDDPQRGRLIITKGDANETPDSEPVKKEQILGKVIFSFPYFGHLVNFAKTQIGFLALIVIPGTLIIYGEVVNIKNEIVKFFLERKLRKEVAKEHEKEINDGVVRKALIILMFSMFALSYLIPTKAYFSNTLSSRDNIFMVGTWDENYIRLNLDFAKSTDDSYVEFNLWGTDLSTFDRYTYKITYVGDGVLQVLIGNGDVLERDEIIVEDLYLGYCSDAGCTDHVITGDIVINVEVFGATPEDTESLTETISD